MKRLIVKSFKEDLKGFLNLVPNRIKAINEAENKPLPKEYGVNKLADELHPSEIHLTVSDVVEIADGVKLITFENKNLPFFRAGQNINIKHAGFSTPFSFLSSPAEKNYKIAVFSESKDIVSQHLFNVKKGDKIISSGPEGLFYYIRLRDKNEITAFCDNQGAPALLSIAKSFADQTEDINLKIIYFDESHNFIFGSLFKELPVTVEYVSDFVGIQNTNGKIYISGTNAFCDIIKKDFPHARINIVNPAQFFGENTKEYQCKVTYRDKEFNFTCFGNETILSSFERNNIPSPAKCKIGECGFCRCRLIDGKVNTINISGIDSVREADKKYNFIHPCRAFAESDLTLAL